MQPVSSSGQLDRRDLLKAAATAASAAAVSSMVDIAVGDDATAPFIDAYADRVSCLPGETVGFCVSTSAKRYAIEIARMGGKREVVFTQQDIAGAKHAVPDNASSNGCRWPAELKIPVNRDWRSGYYQVLLRTEDHQVQGEAFFVVRSSNPGGEAKILLQLCTNTYNAYNQWGGASLYGGVKGTVSRVSFERPYLGFQLGDNFTNQYSGWRRWEQPFVEWAERAGYQLDFASNFDLEFNPEMLKGYRLVLSVGHDEYWSSGMRDNLEKFIADGGNAAFFSGNTCFWQVRPTNEGRALDCWKMDFQQDPVYKSGDYRFLTGTWTNHLINRPENQLTGVSFSYGGYHGFGGKGGDGCYIIHRPDHWVFQGTGLQRGDRLGGKHKIVGYECDGCLFSLQDGLPIPTHEDGTPDTFEILGSAPAHLSMGDRSLVWVSEGLYGTDTPQRVKQPGSAMLGTYTRGGTVFTTGCTEWVRGLQGNDPQVEQITRNVLSRLSKPV